ncbi:paramyosin, short form-like [Onthophagus taurus]|uniref:paramyosin, short form-like n=1 Tax=Onthophagus taurus TaxID=166361 RepID=UPI0039BE639C
MPRNIIKWRDPTTIEFEDDFDFEIDVPTTGTIKRRPKKFPHVPSERPRYRAKLPPRCYSNEDVATISRRCEARAITQKEFFDDPPTPYQLKKSASAAVVKEHGHVEYKHSKSHKILKQINKIQTRMAEDEDPNFDRMVAAGLSATQRILRGKSAKAIETQLLSESLKNINEGVISDQRNALVNTYHGSAHSRMMCERLEKELDDTFMVPLDNLSSELKGFDRKSTQYFFNKR